MAYLSGLCNLEKRPETCRHRLLISRFQVRVLGGSLEKALSKVANKKAPIRRQPIYEARRSRFLAVPGLVARELARHYTSSEADPGAEASVATPPTASASMFSQERYGYSAHFLRTRPTFFGRPQPARREDLPQLSDTISTGLQSAEAGYLEGEVPRFFNSRAFSSGKLRALLRLCSRDGGEAGRSPARSAQTLAEGLHAA